MLCWPVGGGLEVRKELQGTSGSRNCGSKERMSGSCPTENTGEKTEDR